MKLLITTLLITALSPAIADDDFKDDTGFGGNDDVLVQAEKHFSFFDVGEESRGRLNWSQLVSEKWINENQKNTVFCEKIEGQEEIYECSLNFVTFTFKPGYEADRGYCGIDGEFCETEVVHLGTAMCDSDNCQPYPE